ncbi:fungal-specific transcription factor domain-containing protein, partial [Epithele typhae]|uniref:fungal-specific transcription factor domain-containing protein n=1 Tax=Epithele typhae TaxID=378194 RepID=UPI002007DC88
KRACDYCRQKKCDGGEVSEPRCSRCIVDGIDCTYDPNVRDRLLPISYVQSLEDRLDKMEKLVAQLCPDPEELDSMLERIRLKGQEPRSATSPALPPSRPSTYSSPNDLTPLPPGLDASIDSDDLGLSDDDGPATKVKMFGKITQGVEIPPGGALRYHGESSDMVFLQAMMDLKDQMTGMHLEVAPGKVMWSKEQANPLQLGRPPLLPAPHTGFPPRDLIDKLANAYFDAFNMYLPLLHRPTFNKHLDDGKHLTDRGIGSVVFLVCALGARHVLDDPRTVVGHKDPGWHWFEHVDRAKWSVRDRPKLEDLQVCLTAAYLVGSDAPLSGWNIVGLGMRMAQDVGCHRKKMYRSKPTAHDELWKRAFWSLLAFDRMGSFGLGRPAAIHDEDFDTEPLLEVDDEYWFNDDPELCFKQPEGKPSTVALANCFARLLRIFAFASRTIYSINKRKLGFGDDGSDWERRIVTDIDSALNRWMDTIPEHLRLDNKSKEGVFLSQSTGLYCFYYFAQIFVHRPFISSPNKPSRLPFPSLAICTSAARSCIHLIDGYYQRAGNAEGLHQLPLFSSGLVLLLNMWGNKKAGVSFNADFVDVKKCLTLLKTLQGRCVC